MASKNFYNALTKPGFAIFDTMNVQQKRNELENSLINAGFYIPYHKTENWYRIKLAETGIQFNMILGQPIAFWGKYQEDKRDEYQKRDQAILNSFTKEYQSKMQEEAQEVQEIMKKSDLIIAHMVYNTG